MPGTGPGSPALQVDSSLSEPPGKPQYVSPGINEMMGPEQGQGGVILKAGKETESARKGSTREGQGGRGGGRTFMARSELVSLWVLALRESRRLDHFSSSHSFFKILICFFGCGRS